MNDKITTARELTIDALMRENAELRAEKERLRVALKELLAYVVFDSHEHRIVTTALSHPARLDER
jgi:hypothetical protein